jgi:photosystem II stability/assembly factor-like uncharacterized protein
MSELDRDLRALRDELSASIPIPDVDGVAYRARTRRRLQIAVVAVVVAVVAAVPVLRATEDRSQPATPESPKNTSYVLDFADEDHGYALARHCERGAGKCSFSLYRTTDGGRHWAPRNLPRPADPTTGYFDATLSVLGPDTVVIDRPNRSQTQVHSERTTSTDGGATWTAKPRRTELPPAPLPRLGRLTTICGDVAYDYDMCTTLGAIDPQSGGFVVLPAQPPLVPTQFGRIATEDGTLWAVGRGATSDRWAIAVSKDGGRTWSDNTLDVEGTPDPGSWSVVERNGVMYATSGGQGYLAVWRSTDDGRSWRRMWVGSGHGGWPGVTPALVGSPVVTADGELILFDGTTSYVSRDQGLTFIRTGEAAVPVTWTRAGYLRSKVDRFELSTDGEHWREFKVR